MAARVTLVALVDLHTVRKAKGEVFVASAPVAYALIKRGKAREFPTDPDRYQTRMLTPESEYRVAPARTSRKAKS